MTLYTWEIYYHIRNESFVIFKTMPCPPQVGFMLNLDDGVREIKEVIIHFNGSTLKKFIIIC